MPVLESGNILKKINFNKEIQIHPLKLLHLKEDYFLEF
jgi:hypothetical protein